MGGRKLTGLWKSAKIRKFCIVVISEDVLIFTIAANRKVSKCNLYHAMEAMISTVAGKRTI